MTLRLSSVVPLALNETVRVPPGKLVMLALVTLADGAKSTGGLCFWTVMPLVLRLITGATCGTERLMVTSAGMLDFGRASEMTNSTVRGALEGCAALLLNWTSRTTAWATDGVTVALVK